MGDTWLTLAGTLVAGLASAVAASWQINRNQQLSLRKEHIKLEIARMAKLLTPQRVRAVLAEDRSEAAKLVGRASVQGMKESELKEELTTFLYQHILGMVSATVFASRRGLRNHIAFHDALYVNQTGKPQAPLDLTRGEWDFLLPRVRGMRQEAGQSVRGVTDEELCRLWLTSS